MAFETAAATNVSSFAAAANTSTVGQNNQWKADAFVNLWLPTKGGGRRKLGYIALKGNKAFERAIIERLQAGGQEALDALAEVVEFEFHMAEASEESMPAF